MKSSVLQWTSYQLWKAQCRLNRPLLTLWQRDQRRVLEQAWDLDSAKLGPTRPGLCVVISTYKRPEACADLLSQLHISSTQLNIDVFRVRQHFARVGLPGVANVIERRPRSKQLRLGFKSFDINVL